MRKAYFLVALLLCSVATSCVSSQNPVSSQPKALPSLEPLKVPLAPKPILIQRIQLLESYSKKEGISPEDQEAATKVLNTYRAALIASSKALTLEDRERLIQQLFGSLRYIEEIYFGQQRTRRDDLREDILYIEEFHLLPEKKEKSKPEETVLQGKSTVQITTETEKTPAKPLRPGVSRDNEVSPNGGSIDLNSLLEKTDELVQAQRYEEANHLLSMAQEKATAGSEREIIDRTRQYINTEKQKASKTPEKTNRPDEGKVREEAKNLLEQEKYEEAISRLHAVQNTPDDNGEQLARLKENAVNGLIDRERNRAAKFFLKSKKTSDPTEKREALCISRDILTDLILSYPNASKIENVKQHLEVVEKALAELR